MSPVQSLGYIFAAYSKCVALQISEQFYPKASAKAANPLDTEPETD